MKTPEQIKAWLEAQPWNEQFKKEVMSGDDISDKSKKDILDGKRSIITLREGVVMFSADGGWLERNDYFMSWFSNNEENPD